VILLFQLSDKCAQPRQQKVQLNKKTKTVTPTPRDT